jgi:hypothetical protein
MHKSNIILVTSVVVIIVIALIGGGVLAQGDFTSSSEGGDVTSSTYSTDENAPSSGPGAVNSIAHSTLDGMPPAAVEYSADESELHLTSADPVSSGSATGGPIQDIPPELMPGDGSILNLNAYSISGHPYNTSLRYVGSTLKPRENDVDYAVGSNGGCVHVTGGDVSTVWNLPLALPDGAEVQYLRMYFYDQNIEINTVGWFTKYNLYGDLVDEWMVASINGGNNYSTIEISPTETIDYSSYSYVLNWRPYGSGSNLQLCGFRIYYYYPTYGFNFIPWINKH